MKKTILGPFIVMTALLASAGANAEKRIYKYRPSYAVTQAKNVISWGLLSLSLGAVTKKYLKINEANFLIAGGSLSTLFGTFVMIVRKDGEIIDRKHALKEFRQVQSAIRAASYLKRIPVTAPAHRALVEFDCSSCANEVEKIEFLNEMLDEIKVFAKKIVKKKGFLLEEIEKSLTENEFGSEIKQILKANYSWKNYVTVTHILAYAVIDSYENAILGE